MLYGGWVVGPMLATFSMSLTSYDVIGALTAAPFAGPKHDAGK